MAVDLVAAAKGENQGMTVGTKLEQAGVDVGRSSIPITKATVEEKKKKKRRKRRRGSTSVITSKTTSSTDSEIQEQSIKQVVEPKTTARSLADQVRDQQMTTRDSPSQVITAKEKQLVETARGPDVRSMSIKEERNGRRTPFTGVVQPSMIDVASGQEGLEQRDFTKRDFGDVTLVPQFGTATKQFAGIKEGEEQFVDTGFRTFGQELTDVQSDLFKEEAGFKVRQQKRFEEFADPIIEAEQKKQQALIDEGKIDVKTAQTNLDIITSNLNLEEKFLEGESFKTDRSAADKRFKTLAGKEAFLSSQVLEQTSPSTFKGIVGDLKPGKQLKEFQEASDAALFLESAGIDPDEGELRKKTARATLDLGFLVGDIAGAGALATTATEIGARASSRTLSKQLSRELAELDASKIAFGEVVSSGDNFFRRGFTRSTDNIVEAGRVEGKFNPLTDSFSTIPDASGFAERTGKIKLTGGRKILAEFSDAPTFVEFGRLSNFDIAGAAVTRKAGEFSGFETARTLGIGTFSPRETLTFTRFAGEPAELELRLGGQSIASEIVTPSLIKELPKGSIIFTESPGASGVSFVTNIGRQPLDITDVRRIVTDESSTSGLVKTQAIKSKQTFDVGLPTEALKEGLQTTTQLKPFQFVSQPTIKNPPILPGNLIVETKQDNKLSSPSSFGLTAPKTETLFSSKALMQSEVESLTRNGSTRRVAALLPFTGSQLGVGVLTEQSFNTGRLTGVKPSKIIPGALSFSPVVPTISSGGGFFPKIGRPGGFGFGLPKLPSLKEGRGFGSGFGTQRRVNIRPSLTGIAAFELGGITGELPKGGIGLRFVPTEFGLPKTKKKKKDEDVIDFSFF